MSLLGLGGAIIGGWLSSRGSSRAADSEREAAERRLQFDQEARDMRWDKLNADRAWIIEGNRIKALNDERAAAYRDATARQQYVYDLAIRNREQASLEAQFAKSNELYDKTVTQNAKAAQTATDSEWRKLDEIHTEAAFDAQEQRLEYLQQEGKIRARGAAGRSAGKVQQSAMSSFGQQVAMLNEGIASAGRNTKAMIEQIQDDQYSADLAAWAAKMLDPGVLPMPMEPILTPRTIYQDPRELEEFDKGPEPVLGGYPSSGAASMQAWGAAIPSIATALGSIDFKAWSDIELKENISKVGQSPSGLNIYEWNYIGELDRYRGVLAQDLIAHGREDAVEEAENGYLMVRYDKIDVDMQQLIK